ncbi:MAG TPA: hypothetical protein VGP13_02155, partial [Candidatus Paceibacterota bacterium]|nr:hypothetical protein [Candidatus Paceibacterota bacterium]
WFGPGMLDLGNRRFENMQRVSLARTLWGNEDRSDARIKFRLASAIDDNKLQPGCRIRHTAVGVEVWMPLRFFASQAVAYLTDNPDLPLGKGGLGSGVAEGIRAKWETIFGKTEESVEA